MVTKAELTAATKKAIGTGVARATKKATSEGKRVYIRSTDRKAGKPLEDPEIRKAYEQEMGKTDDVMLYTDKSGKVVGGSHGMSEALAKKVMTEQQKQILAADLMRRQQEVRSSAYSPTYYYEDEPTKEIEHAGFSLITRTKGKIMGGTMGHGMGMTSGFAEKQEQAFYEERKRAARERAAAMGEQFKPQTLITATGQAVSKEWEGYNQWVTEHTPLKYIPTKEQIKDKGQQRFREIQKKLEKNPEWQGATGLQAFNPWGEGKYSKDMIKAAREGKSFEEYAKTDPALRGAFAVHEHIREKPLTTAAYTGLGFGAGYGMTALASTGVTGATTVSLGGKVLAGAYATGVGLKFSTHFKTEDYGAAGELLGKTSVQLAAFGSGAIAGSGAAIKKGYFPQQSAEPKIRYEKIKGTTLGGKEETMWRGLEVTYGKGGKSKIIWSSRFKTQGFKDITSPIEHPAQAQAILKNLKGVEKLRYKQALKELSSTHFTKTPGSQRKALDPGTRYLTKEQDIAYLKYVKNVRKQVRLEYGSTTSKAQTQTKIWKKWRGSGEASKPGDWDVQFSLGEKATAKHTQNIVKLLNNIKGGTKVRVSSKNPTLIETTTGHHVIDIHTLNQPIMPEAAGSGFAGYSYGQKPYIVDGHKIMRLSESGTRKAASSLTPRIKGGKLTIAPETHRTKDIPDMLMHMEQLNIYAGQSTKGVGKIAGTYPKKLLTPEGISVSYMPSPSVSSIRLYPPFISPSPSPSISPSPSRSPYRSPSRSPSPSPSPSISPSPSRSPYRSPSLVHHQVLAYLLVLADRHTEVHQDLLVHHQVLAYLLVLVLL